MANLKVRISDELESILNEKCKSKGMNKSEYIRHIIVKSNITNKVNQSHSLAIMQDVNHCLSVLMRIDAKIEDINCRELINFKNEISILNHLITESINAC